ncbi:MAG: hypothetical protein GF317_01370 [Candidatus Lokiarchaeota archaeon]|nr:hypothetical protein [Candidatus Lokiarchaeota archaeon]MBD3198594.1 hypothetical protein [Candidatus Lokiarchaeota archaeon]
MIGPLRIDVQLVEILKGLYNIQVRYPYMDINNKTPSSNFNSKQISMKDDKIIFSCINCKDLILPFQINSKCFNCISKELLNYRKENITKIVIKSKNRNIDINDLSIFYDIQVSIRKVKQLFNEFFKLKKFCNFKNYKCEILSDIKEISTLYKNECYYNPLDYYNFILSLNSKIDKGRMSFFSCKKCYQNYKKITIKLIKILEGYTIIKVFKNFNSKRDLFNNYSNIYDLIFSNYYLIRENFEPSFNQLVEQNNLIECYNFGDFNLFKARVYKVKYEKERYYEIELFFQKSDKKEFYKKLLKKLYKELTLVEIDIVFSLEDLIELYYNESLKLIDHTINLSNKDKKRLSFWLALKKLRIERILPFLIDDNIEEIFLDNSQDTIYINHKIYGRCRSNIKLTNHEIERIKTFVRLYSNKRLDQNNPSAKLTIKNKYFHCRFSIDISPIHYKNFAMDIRKLNKDIYNIQDLLKNGTLNPEIASFIFLCIQKRMNLTVVGKTDSGKTTLINCLDLLVSKDSRKVYVENVIESIDQSLFGNHQLKYKVDSLSENQKNSINKSDQIKRLLHRTPDIIYLGEILTKEEAEAMFHCLAAGLKGFQTIHANNVEALINRFIYHFDIAKNCLNDLDLIIFMRKDEKNKRRIVSISQILFNDSKISIKTIFKYNPLNHTWDKMIPLFKTNIIQEIAKYEDLDADKFNIIFGCYSEFFNKLSLSEKQSNLSLVKLIHKFLYEMIKKELDLEKLITTV